MAGRTMVVTVRPVPYSSRKGREPAYALARRWIDECLLEDGSLLTPPRPIWTAENLGDLKARFVDVPVQGADTFEAKLQHQLTGATDEVKQLAAEVLCVHYIVPVDIGATKKTAAVTTVLGWMATPVPVADDVAAAFRIGLINAGQGYKMYKPNQLWFVIEAAIGFKGCSPEERRQLLEDPWALKAMLAQLPIRSGYLTSNLLLHLLHPETFEPIGGRDHKSLIVSHFHELTEETDQDRALLDIRAKLESTIDGPFDFYRPQIRKQWLPGARPPKAWFVRGANVHGQNLVPRWVEEGFCSIGWLTIGHVESPASTQEILERLRDAYPDHKTNTLKAWTGEIHRFVDEMEEGDIVLTVDPARLRVGEIQGPVEWAADENVAEVDPTVVEVEVAPRRRAVEWWDQAPARETLPDVFQPKLKTMLAVTEVSDLLPFIEAFRPGPELVPPPGTSAILKTPDPQLADRLHLPHAWLVDIVELLREKRQVILYGPPGTGKTYLATKLAEHLVEDPADAQLIQFHPSYGYEDFFEGYRPITNDEGAIVFELRHGPLRLLAGAAAAASDRPFILVVDEINRANLAKVFGELYFSLEYRDTAVRLQYSPDQPFTLPKNLYVIGTMNTADRSIALVDAAMRRRFYFVELFPARYPIDGLLRAWLSANKHPSLAADLLEELNSRIGDPDAAIGPSYLMGDDQSIKGLERVWQRGIMPLLEEHYLGTGRDVAADFGFAAVRSTAPQQG